MFNFKRDWLYSAKSIFICFIGIQLLFLLLGVLCAGHQFTLIFIREFYQTVYQLSCIFVMIYPIYVLKMISPRRSSFFDATLNTAALPFTRKKLFFNGVKHWFYLGPLYLIGQYLINYFLSVVLLGMDFNDFFYESIFNSLFVTLLLIALVLQSIAAIIKCLADNVKWYWLLSSIVIGNLLYIFISALLLECFQLNSLADTKYFYLILIPLILISAIICGTNFNKIERIYQ